VLLNAHIRMYVLKAQMNLAAEIMPVNYSLSALVFMLVHQCPVYLSQYSKIAFVPFLPGDAVNMRDTQPIEVSATNPKVPLDYRFPPLCEA